jgi:polyferredoxin
MSGSPAALPPVSQGGQETGYFQGIPVTLNGRTRAGRLPRLAGFIEQIFVRHRDRLAWVHAVFFVLFLALIFLPLLLPEAPEDATPLNNFAAFSIYLLWGVWFPLVFLSVIFTGRSWCGILCPMGAASEWANKKGLKRPIPAWVRWEGTPIASFIIITILGQTVGVRDHPEAVAEVFGGTLLAALLLGFIYGRNKRAWCRHMCPIGLLLGVFSRIGAWQFVPKRKRAGGDRYTEKTVCPTMIDIARKEESRHCIECFRCVNPRARGGLMLKLRIPGEEIAQIRSHNPNPYEVWFLFLGTGVSVGGFLWLVLPFYWELRQAVAEWFFGHGWFWVGESGPAWLMSVHPDRREVFAWLDFITISGFMIFWMLAFAAVLGFTTWLAAWLSGKQAGDRSLRERFVELGYQYTPVAMVSLVIGLGATLFGSLVGLGLSAAEIAWVKTALFLGGLLWSLWLGNRILGSQGVAAGCRWLPLAPGLAGCLFVGAVWWPGIFGV